MTMRRFEIFVSIAKHRSITQASRELHVSQPAVSRQVKLLEADYGIALLKKLGNGIELTSSGQDFLKEIVPILSQIEGLRKKYGGTISESVNETLTIGGSDGPSSLLLPTLMAAFRKKYPTAQLNLHTASSPEIEDLLLASKADVAIITNPTVSSSLRMDPYRREKLIAFVSPDHPLANKRYIEPSELAEIPLVVRLGKQGQTWTEQLPSDFSKRSLKLKVAIRCESTESVKELVRSGAGMGILYHDVVKREIDRNEFRIVNLAGVDLTERSYVVYSKVRPLSSLAREFLSLLRARVAKDELIKTAMQISKSQIVQTSMGHS